LGTEIYDGERIYNDGELGAGEEKQNFPAGNNGFYDGEGDEEYASRGSELGMEIDDNIYNGVKKKLPRFRSNGSANGAMQELIRPYFNKYPSTSSRDSVFREKDIFLTKMMNLLQILQLGLR